MLILPSVYTMGSAREPEAYKVWRKEASFLGNLPTHNIIIDDF